MNFHYKKDGTLDMRYSSSRAAASSFSGGGGFSSSGLSNTRSYAVSSPSYSPSAPSLHYKKDGTLDMRYNSSKAATREASSSPAKPHPSGVTAAPATSTRVSSPGTRSGPDVHYRKDGTTPDMRFTTSKQLVAQQYETLSAAGRPSSPSSTPLPRFRKDGSLDMRYKASREAARRQDLEASGVPLTKKGLPDLRTKEAKQWVQVQAETYKASHTVPNWIPKKKDGTPDFRKAVTRAFFKDEDSAPPPPARETYYERRIEIEEFLHEVLEQMRREVVQVQEPMRLEATDRLRQEFERVSVSPGTTPNDAEPSGASSLQLPQSILQLNYTDLDMTSEKPLGRGSFGVVVKGQWKGKEVGVKRLHQSKLSKREKAAFIKETTILACLGEHENIVRLHGYTLEPLTLVMEYVELGSLSYLLHYCEETAIEAKITDGRIKKNLVLGIAYGMAQLHSSGVTHGDLKPQNVLVTNAFSAKIADFGLATLRSKAGTSVSSHIVTASSADLDDDDDDANNHGVGGVCGTAGYMAPELLNPQVMASQSTDVFSFGVLLNEILQEEEPYYEKLHQFHGKGPFAAVNYAKEGNRPAVNLNRTTAELQKLVQRCWSAVPAERPTFDEVITSLKPLTIPNSFTLPTSMGR